MNLRESYVERSPSMQILARRVDLRATSNAAIRPHRMLGNVSLPAR